MPRFYFDRTDGEREVDVDGCELADKSAARAKAVVFLADAMREAKPEDIWNGHSISIEILDDSHKRLWSLTVRSHQLSE